MSLAALATANRYLEAADEERQVLVALGDWQRLAKDLARLRDFVRELALFMRQLEDDVARLMPEKRCEVDGLGILERRKGTDRKHWDSEELLRRLVRLAVDPHQTGELPSAAEVVDRIETMVTTCLPITPSLGWRVLGLKAYEQDPDQWCESSPGRMTVQITGGGS